MLELLNKVQETKSDWEGDALFRIKMIQGGTRLFSVGLEGTATTMHYDIDGPAINTITGNLIDYSIPNGVDYIYLKSSPSHNFTIMRIYGTGVSEVEWARDVKVTRLFFSACTNLVKVSDHLPRSVNSLWSAFYGCVLFNFDISGWDVSNVTIMNQLMRDAKVFNQNLSNWNVSKVTSRTAYDTNAIAWSPSNKPKFV